MSVAMERPIGRRTHNNRAGENDRAHRRQPCDALCKIGASRSTVFGTISDASAAGAQCKIANGLMLEVGETVYFEWPDASAAFATVAWVRGNRLGLRFTQMVPDFADKLDTASLGSSTYCRTIAMQIALADSQR